MTSFLWIIYILAIGTAVCAEVITSCGGLLTANRGIIQTPNFPNKFDVPIKCVWIINATTIEDTNNISIVIYFTQQYVLSGLKFTEYIYYSNDFQIKNDKPTFEFNEYNVTEFAWLQFSSRYLEIEFTMDNLHGTHLRALDRLLDVYGFNITYEVDEVKPYQCSALKCRFLGQCFAQHDFS